MLKPTALLGCGQGRRSAAINGDSRLMGNRTDETVGVRKGVVMVVEPTEQDYKPAGREQEKQGTCTC